MTPINEYSKFCCPNPSCKFYGIKENGNIKHRSWTGKNKDIERLLCRECSFEFSSRRGTLIERSSLCANTVARVLKCFRWGLHDEAIADVCEIDQDTVVNIRNRAAIRAQIHHDQEVKELKEPAAEADELYVKLSQKSSCWIAAVILTQCLLVVSLAVGARNQSMADKLIAETRLRCSWLLIIFTDGWRPYLTAIIRCFGKLTKPRRKHVRGPNPKSRLKVENILYAQVVKMRDLAYKLVGVQARSWIGSMKECLDCISLFKLGKKIHTAHIERFWASFRCYQAFARRRSRCLVKTEQSCSERTWLWISLYNWVITHSSLTISGIKRTPAMAAGLINRPLSYEEYVLMPIFDTKRGFKEKITSELERMNEPQILAAASRTKTTCERYTVWEKPPDIKDEYREGIAC
jgi:transposase-like protein